MEKCAKLLPLYSSRKYRAHADDPEFYKADVESKDSPASFCDTPISVTDEHGTRTTTDAPERRPCIPRPSINDPHFPCYQPWHDRGRNAYLESRGNGVEIDSPARPFPTERAQQC